MTLKFMRHEVNYQVIIKTRSICMFRYISHTIYLRTQVERGWLLETDGIDESCLEWVPCMPGTMIQEYLVLSQNVPLGTGTYCMPELEQDNATPTRIGLGTCNILEKREEE